jgi:hypothetical protein
MGFEGQKTFQDFIADCNTYKGLVDNPVAREIFVHLSSIENISWMVNKSKNGRPALEGCIEGTEAQFGGQRIFDLDSDFNRQALGTMIREILEPFGYEVCGRKRLRHGISNYAASASVYTLNPDKRLLYLENTVVLSSGKRTIERREEAGNAIRKVVCMSGKAYRRTEKGGESRTVGYQICLNEDGIKDDNFSYRLPNLLLGCMDIRIPISQWNLRQVELGNIQDSYIRDNIKDTIQGLANFKGAHSVEYIIL